MKFLNNIDLNLNELQNVVIHNLATDPQVLKAGLVWFNTTTHLFKFYDGTTVHTFVSLAALTTILLDYQAKIVASGVLKGDGAGGVTAAVAGTDYAYAELTGSTAPTTATEGAVGQHYLDTTTSVEYVCTAVIAGDTPTYTWARVTVDISGKQDVIDADHKLPVAYVDGLAAVATSGSYDDLSDTPDIPQASDDNPLMDGTASAGSSEDFSRKDHVHPSDTSRQVKITASGILKGDGNGGVTAATADTDFQSVITVDANKALVSDANGKVSASSITATELGYLAGVTGAIQTQIDNIPKYNYLDAVTCTVADGATQEQINTAALAAIATAYATPSKWDAVNVEVKFTPSDTFKNAVYYYNGSAWSFLFYVTTGIQLANGTTAGLIQEADSNSDLTIASGVATVNVATALRTARNITVQGSYGASSTDGITATAASFDGTGNATINITAIKVNMLTGVLPVAKGGTGKNSITNGKVLVGNASGGFDELGIDTTVTEDSGNLVTSGAVAAAIGGGNVAHKYTENNPVLAPTSGVASWTVTHNLNTRAVTVEIIELSTYNKVMADITMTSTSALTIKINAAASIAADTYQVTVIG